MSSPEPFKIFTDGSSLSNPRVGGIGIRYVYIDESGDEQTTDFQEPGYKSATNNQMELQACIFGLINCINIPEAAAASEIIVCTDSLYVVDNINSAKFDWPKTKWRTTAGRPVLNADLWKDLVKAIRKTNKRVSFQWVKGHAKNQHNKAVDNLAKLSARNASKLPLSVIHVRRKKTSESVDVGSVKIEGQTFTIRIITTEYLEVQKLWKCKYEVVSKTSPYFAKVDLIFSVELLEAGHTYRVRVNRETDNPSIVRMIRELKGRKRVERANPR
ncbi:MAG: ribonuclease H [Anaerolineales bacterium]